MNSHDSVTTFVPSRSLDDYESEAKSTVPFNGGIKRQISWSPTESRRRALIRLIKHQEGREALLQLLQSTLLLLYSYAPSRQRRRQMHLFSESISSFRKFLLVARYLIEGNKVVQEQLSQHIADREKGESEETHSNHSNPETSHDEAVDSWRQAWQRRVESVSEYFSIGADTCDLLAFIGGSSMLWGVLGGKVARRQRRGLERLALYLAFLSMLFSLVHIRQLRKYQGNRLRRANRLLLKVTDEVAEEDARRVVQGHPLLPEQVIGSDIAPRDVLEKSSAVIDRAQIDHELRRTEHRLFVEKKKLDHIKLQRTATRFELLFALMEILRPEQDHSRLEGYTGVIASLCHISRLAGESRWRL